MNETDAVVEVTVTSVSLSFWYVHVYVEPHPEGYVISTVLVVVPLSVNVGSEIDFKLVFISEEVVCLSTPDVTLAFIG